MRLWYISILAFGKLIENKSKHQTCKIVESKNVPKYANRPRFTSAEPLYGDFFEVLLGKQRYIDSAGRIAGHFILSSAKVSCLRFYYGVIKKYLSAECRLLSHDTGDRSIRTALPYLINSYLLTDSFYLALTDRNWGERLKQNKEFNKDRIGLLALENEPVQPGAFRIEFEGEAYIALSSKTCYGIKRLTEQTSRVIKLVLSGGATEEQIAYVKNLATEGKAGDGDKLSSKGVQLSNRLTELHFLFVLLSKQFYLVTNRGFMRKPQGVVEYQLEKIGLNYFNFKREPLNTFETRALNI